MMRRQVISMSAAALAVVLASAPAHAEDAGLHHAQGGALLSFLDTEVKLLFAAISAREFDLDLTRALAAELKRAAGDAKKSADRTSALLPEKQEKLKPDVEELRGAIKKIEDQLAKVEAEIEKQGGPAPSDHADDDEEGGEKEVQRDWGALKDATGWLYVDVAAARALHDKVGKKLGVPGLKAPPKPKGNRS